MGVCAGLIILGGAAAAGETASEGSEDLLILSETETEIPDILIIKSEEARTKRSVSREAEVQTSNASENAAEVQADSSAESSGVQAGSSSGDMSKLQSENSADGEVETQMEGSAGNAGTAQESHTGICAEGEYVVLPTAGMNRSEIFDCEGRRLGTCRLSVDSSMPFRVGKDTLGVFQEQNINYVYSFALLDNILELPTSEYLIQVQGGYCLTAELGTGLVRMYDNRGKELWRIAGYPDTDPENYYRSIRFCRVGEGVLLWAERYSYEGTSRAEYTILEAPIWVSWDGKTVRRVTDETLASEMLTYGCKPFGDALLVENWASEVSRLYSLDGDVLMEGALHAVNDYSSTRWYSHYSFEPQARYLLKEEHGWYTVYDTGRAACGSMEVPERYPECNGEFLSGLAYEELGGRVCSGFVQYGDEQTAPFARAPEGCYVYTEEDGLRLLPVPPDVELAQFNEAYGLGYWYDEEENYRKALFDIRTGEVIWNMPEQEIGKNASVELAKEYYRFFESVYSDEEGYWSRNEIIDNQGVVRYSSEKAYCYTWQDSYIMLRRGIYVGIADMDGHWIIKTTGRWQD